MSITKLSSNDLYNTDLWVREITNQLFYELLYSAIIIVKIIVPLSLWKSSRPHFSVLYSIRQNEEFFQNLIKESNSY